MTPPDRPLDRALHESVTTIWATMFDLEARPFVPPPTLTPSRLTACVQISGAWHGALTLDCPDDLARRIAGIMFSMPAEELDGELVRDAVGELTNILGGNFKTLLPEPCSLSLPAVTAGGDSVFRGAEARPVGRLGFVAADRPFVVTVLEGPP